MQLWFDPAEVFIGGRWFLPASGETLPLEDPSTGKEIGRIARGSAEDIDNAVTAAQEALASEWGALTAAERGRILTALGRLVEVFAAVVVMILYAEMLPVAGFVIATAFAAGYLAWRLGSHPIEAVAVGIGTSVGIYVIFHLLLGLSLAKGPFGF